MKLKNKSHPLLSIRLFRLVILVALFFQAQRIWPNEQESSLEERILKAQESEVKALVESSKATRDSLAATRQVANLSESDNKWARDFEQIQNDDSDKNWFDEVDKLIENTPL